MAYGYAAGGVGHWGGAPPQPSVAEPVFFQDSTAYVSRSRVVLQGVTYPVNGITRVYWIRLPKSAVTLVLGILGLLFALMMFLGGVGSDSAGPAIFLAFIVGLVSAGLIALYIWVQRDRYVLVLGTAGHDVHASWSFSQQYVFGILMAINNALASRY